MQKQHPSEVRSLLAGLAPAEIAEIIDELDPEELFLAWERSTRSAWMRYWTRCPMPTRDTLASRSSYLGGLRG